MMIEYIDVPSIVITMMKTGRRPKQLNSFYNESIYKAILLKHNINQGIH